MADASGPYSGRVLGGYRVGPRLTSHPHGEVYRARDDRLDREVVVKLVPGGAASPAAQARCLAEARVAARIDHPYATRVYGHGVEGDGTCWIALEWVRGPTLAALVEARGPLGVVDTVDLIGRLAEVLATMHEQGLWHRDLKPDNILVLSRAGRRLPTLCDFGLTALAIDGPAGTPAYMAPEQWLAGAIDARTDVYALALCAWFALTGRHGFDGADAALAIAHARGARPRLPASLPAALDAVLVRALAIDPRERPSGALAFAAELRAAVDDRIRPRLDETLVEVVLTTAPEPIAEAMAAWEAAATPRAELGALNELATVIARWLAVCAVAIRRDRGQAPMLATLGVDGLSAAAWLALVAADDDAGSDGELAIALDRVARTVRLGADDDPGPRVGLDDRIAAQLAAVERLVRAAGAILAHRVVVRTGARVERWTGVRRRRRPAVWIEAPDALPDGVAVVIDDAGRPLAILDGLTAIAAPIAGEPDELFVLAARDGDQAVLTTVPTGYQRRVAASAIGLPEAAVAADAASEDRGPYRGLAAFGTDDAGWFVGREREAEACLNRLRDRPLVVVVGPSGVGKSSFVLAGVVPGARARHVVVCRPGDHPLEALASALAAASTAGDPPIDGRANATAPTAGDRPVDGRRNGLATAASAPSAGDRPIDGRVNGVATAPTAAAIVARARVLAADGLLLIVVDQLEELVTRASAAAAADFGAAIAVVTAIADARVVATVRDDFLVRVAAATGLTAAIGAGVLLLGPPAIAELLRIVVEPAARAGYRFDDPELPAAMVAAAVEATSPLPLLSFAARALWLRRDRRLKQMCRRDLEALGGIVGALASHADATVDALPGDGDTLVRPLLANLATAEGTRIALPRTELIELVAGDQAAAVIDRLIDARLLVSRDGAAGPEVELVHEALLTAWPRLRRWRQDDALAAQLRDSVRAAAQSWEARGHPRDLLWRGDALDELRVWRRRHALRLTRRDEAFCVASLREARRRQRRRQLAVGVGFLAIVVVALVLARANREARIQRRAASAAEARAVASGEQSHARLLDALVEQGRTAALDGRPLEALAWLDAAVDAGAARPPLARLIGEAAAAIDHAIRPAIALTARVHVAAWSPSGARVAIGGSTGDARVIVLDRRGAVVRALPELGDTITSVAIAPDDRRVAAVTRSGGLRVWDIDSGATVATIDADLTRARWSPDGRWLAASGGDGVAHLFDGATLTPARTIAPLDGEGARVVSVAWLDRDRLVIGDRRGRLRLCAAIDGRVVATIASDVPVLDLITDPRGVAILPYDRSRTAHWSPDTGALDAFTDHQAAIDAIAASPDGTHLVTAAADGTLLVSTIATGRVDRALIGHRGSVGAVAYLGAVAVSGGADGTVRAWYPDATVTRPGHAAAITALAASADGAMVVTGDADGRIALWPAAEIAPPPTVELVGVTAVVVAGARRIALGAGLARGLVGPPLPALHPAAAGVEGPITVAYRRTGGGSARGAIAIPDGDAAVLVDGAQVVARCAIGAPVLTAAVSADGAWLAGTTRDGAALCRGGEPAQPIAGVRGAVWAAAFAPDGAALAVAGQDRAVRVVTLATGAVATAQLRADVTGLVWLDDAHLVATTLAGDVQRIGRDGAIGAALTGAGVAANAIARVDGDHVVIGYDDGDVALVALALARPVARWRLGGTVTWIAVDGAALIVTLRDRMVTVPLAPIDGFDRAALVRCRAGLRVDGGRLIPTVVRPVGCS